MAVLQRSAGGSLNRTSGGSIVRAAAGVACCCGTANLYAPVRYCDDTTIATLDGATCYGPCVTTGDGIKVFWFDELQACGYFDCSEATSVASPFLPIESVSLTDCTVCDFDNNGTPDPHPTDPPGTPVDVTGCTCTGHIGLVTAAVNVTGCTCANTFNVQELTNLNKTVSLIPTGGGCTWVGYYFFNYKTCPATSYVGRAIITATLSGGQWTATVTGQFYNPFFGWAALAMSGTIFTCTTPTGDCTGGTLVNENGACPGAATGGTLTISAVVLP